MEILRIRACDGSDFISVRIINMHIEWSAAREPALSSFMLLFEPAFFLLAHECEPLLAHVTGKDRRR